MKNKRALSISAVLAVPLLFLLIISCGSPPAPAPEEEGPRQSTAQAAPDPSQQAPDKAKLDALNSARAQAENARKKALDVQGQAYFPDEWDSAEKKNEAGKNAKTDTVGDVDKAIASFEAAAKEYEDIADKSGPLLAKDQEDALNALNAAIARAEKSRQGAQEAKGPVYFPADWESAEAVYKDGGDAKKETIDEMKAATALYVSAADAYDDIAGRSGPLMAKERDDAMKALNAAIARADKSRQGAQDAKAPAYFPRDWAGAETKYQGGKDAKKDSAEEIKAATALYVSAADAYDDMAKRSQTQLAKEKDDAMKALNAAMARADKSRQNAQDANGPVYFAADWKNAETKYQGGKSAKKDSPEEIKAATALYVSAADAYDDIAKRSGPLMAKEKDDAMKELNAAMARADKSRKSAQDVDGPANFPKEWAGAETKYQGGKDAKKTTTAEIKAATALYTAAANEYDGIVGKNTARIAKERDDAMKALNAAMARADKSRQNAQDANGPVYFAADWKNAETTYQGGKSAKKDSPEEIKAATALYVSAADAYDDIAGRSKAQLAKDQADAQAALNAAIARADKSRQSAQAANGPAYFPADWTGAETTYQGGKDAKKATPDEIKAATALYIAAADAYDDIAKRSQAQLAKDQAQLAKDQADAQKALSAAIARAEKSRQNAQAANGPAYFPADWTNAETTYQGGKDAKKDSPEEIKAATALYIAAADAYDDITKRSGPLAAKEKDDAMKALNAAMARAEQSRNNAIDAQGPSYFPKDWINAETKNKAGKDAKKATPDEIKAATALYIAAADAYDDITKRSGPLAAKEKEDAQNALNAAMARAQKSRNDALNAQAPGYFPNDWKNAEAKNQAGESAKKTTPDEIRNATALYIAAADAYDSISGRIRDDALNALNAAMARAQKSRNDALNAEAPSYFPGDWENAEGKNRAGESAKKTTPDEIRNATALYVSAADAYDDIAGRSRTLMAQKKEEEAAQNELNAAMARAQQARSQALGFQGPVYFPQDWASAESQTRAGEAARRGSAAELKAAAAMYAAAADAYDDITRKSRPQYIQAWEESIRRERAAAVDAGITDIAPDHLRSADGSADEIRGRLASADYIPNDEETAAPIDRYRALKPRADAHKARQEIIVNGLGAYDPANLNAGDESTRAAIAEYEAGNPKASRDRADEALARYNEALMSAWMALAREKRLEASREREAALAVKANIAVRDEFNGADRIYQEAMRDFDTRAFKESAELYGRSATLFIAAARAAEDKRRRAEEAIGAARQKTAESAALANSMGLIIEEGQDE